MVDKTYIVVDDGENLIQGVIKKFITSAGLEETPGMSLSRDPKNANVSSDPYTKTLQR